MSTRRGLRFLMTGLLLLALILACLSALAVWALGPSAACRRPATGPVHAGDSARTLLSGGLERCYLLYVPPGLNPTSPVPVVLNLHGFAGSARSQSRVTSWSDLAEEEGVVIVYPEGTEFPLRWNAHPAFGAESVDDVQFLRDVVADLSRIVAVDPARVYVSGMSNGGAMTFRLACEAADLFASAGTVAALPVAGSAACTPARPVPVVAFHGTADPLVNYEGGASHDSALRRLLNLSRNTLDYPPVEAWIASWAAQNGCDPSPELLPSTGDVSGQRYTGCREGAEVVLYTIDEGGHTWPGGMPIPLMGKTSTDVDASAVMWAFFQAHPIPSAQR